MQCNAMHADASEATSFEVNSVFSGSALFAAERRKGLLRPLLVLPSPFGARPSVHGGALPAPTYVPEVKINRTT